MIVNDDRLLGELMDPATLTTDRKEIYRELRDRAPVLQIPGGPVLATRYADVHQLYRQPDGRVQPPGSECPPWLEDGPAKSRLTSNIVQTNPPVHGRLRGVLASLFIGPRAEELREVARASARAQVDRILGAGGRFDAVAELAMEVPKGTLSHLLGFAPDGQHWSDLLDAQHDYLAIFSPVPLDDDQRARLDEVVQFYFGFFERLMLEPGPEGRTELVQAVFDAEQSGEIARHESLSLMHTVLDAGFETSRTSIANAVELLALDPSLGARLRERPEALATAVEEMLRVRPPVQFFPRFVGTDMELSDGTTLTTGTHVLPLIGAANLDERTYPDPLAIDLDRANAATHLAFGGGRHRCLGAPLARVQLQETVRALVESFDAFDLPDGPGPRYPDLMFPSLTSLPTVATATRAA